MDRRRAALWFARLTLAVVFFFNVSCAIAFIGRPEAYAPSFEVSGTAGAALIRAIGLLFLMWNVTYPLATWNPWGYRWLFAIILLQQTIGVAGETWMLLALPPGHEDLAESGLRFIAFDAGGLVAMGVAFALLQISGTRPQLPRSLPSGPHAVVPVPPGSPDAGSASEGNPRR